MKKFLSAFIFFATSFGCNELFSSPAQSMGYEEIVRLQKPQDVAISPDGSKVAYVIKTAYIEKNKNIFTIYVWDSKKSSARALWVLDSVKKVVWQDSETIYVLGKKEEEHQILLAKGEEKKVLISSPVPISVFTFSQDGDDLYYSQTIYTSQLALKKAQEEGYVYRFGTDNVCSTIIEKEYTHCECEEIWHLDRRSGKTASKAKIPYTNWIDSPSYNSTYCNLISNIQLCENGRYLSLNTYRRGNPALGECAFMNDLFILDLKNGMRQELLEDSHTIKTSPCWVHNQLVFQEVDFGCNAFTFWIWNAENNTCSSIEFFHPNSMIQSLVWNEKHKTLIAEDGKNLFQISMASQEIEEIKLPDTLFHHTWQQSTASFDHNLRFVGAISEDSATPAQVVVYDLQKKTATSITSLNPEIHDLSLGKIEKIDVEIEGLSAIGYLIHPINEVEGKRYPLIIATYGFCGQIFIADGEWHSSFPAQTLAAEGYMVLLLNTPKSNVKDQSLVGDPETVRRLLGADRLAVFEHAVDMLDERGCIDPSKVGLYGWSHGAFVVEYLISHSNKFHVACIGEGGDYNPAGFWLGGNLVWPRILVNTFGGPPWGASLKNYVELSPFFNVDKIKTPLLMEFSGGAIQGMEMYTPLRYLNVPAEFVIYEGEAHNFELPKARIASMARKVDWFNYWLLDKREQDKAEQYARWDEMKNSFQARID